MKKLGHFKTFCFTTAGLKKPGCGVSDNVRDWMDNVQNSGEASTEMPPATPPPPPPQQPEEVNVSDDPTPSFKYTAEANDPHVRRKRALANSSNKKSCSLYIQTDPLFWDHIYKQVCLGDTI